MISWQNSRDTPGEYARFFESEVNGALCKNRNGKEKKKD
jgi:hypothetical protein